MSDLDDLLGAIRALYIRRFEEVRAGFLQSGAKVVEEPALLDCEGEVVRDGPLNIGVRVDLVVLAEGGAHERVSIDSDRRAAFEPETFSRHGLQIAISPFQWDYVELTADGDFGALSKALAAWFDQAFAAEGASSEGLGVVHFMSDPKQDGGQDSGKISCILDLGTASASAVASLFDHLRDAGTSRVELGQPAG